MVLAQITVDAPKYGDSSRTAAISAPSDPAPTTKTSNPSGAFSTGPIFGVERRAPPLRRPPFPLASVHPAAGLDRGGGAARDRVRRGLPAGRQRGPPLHRRRLLAV